MGIKEEVQEMKNEVKSIKTQSIAREILQDLKKSNKRMFVIIIVLICMWAGTIGAFMYYINTIDYEEVVETAEVNNDEGNANACVGDNCNNGVINNGESNSN